MLRKIDLNRNPYLGVFCRAGEEKLFCPRTATGNHIHRMAEALGAELVQVSLGCSSLIGSLSCANSKGVLISNIATRAERDVFEKHAKAAVLQDRLNAVGNNILANDFGALVNPDYGTRAIEFIGNALGVPVFRGTIASLKTVGAAAAATNRGALCHPHVTETELKTIEEALGVHPMIGTANYGIPMIGACLITNSKGAVVGTPTTTVELGRIEEALGLY